ncbi:MAG: 30S ribosomal protein S16 [Candidatus Porifericomitaceae bacterium WSBS_2022_MAG_OTU9]
MLKIRLSRSGAPKRPFYHIVVADVRRKRGGRYTENIGFYDPVARGASVPLRFDVERAQYWISQGAQPTERVKALLRQATTVPAAE